MADFSALKTSIQNYIKQNGNEEITGNLLQQILLSMVSTLGDSAINDLVIALNAEIANRGNADTELGGRITTLQGVVNGIVANVENGYVYAGIATPSTTPVSGKVFYLALTAGTYTNFGATVVPQGINILKYNGSAWSLDSFLGLDDAPTQGSNNFVKSGGVLDSIIKDGSAFDLSAYNNGTKYTDLSAALTALNALPAAYKKGGMSMKYVQTSDNKYVQYRYMLQYENTTSGNTSFLNTANWQGVEDIISPITTILDNSDDLVKVRTSNLYDERKANYGKLLNGSNGGLIDSSDSNTSDYVQCNQGDVIKLSNNGEPVNGQRLWWYNESKQPLNMEGVNNTYTAVASAKYFRVSFNPSHAKFQIEYNNVTPYHKYGYKYNVVDEVARSASSQNATQIINLGTQLSQAESSISDISENVDSLEKSLTLSNDIFLEDSYNLLNPYTINYGKFLNGSNGGLMDDQSFNTSDYIACNQGDKVYFYTDISTQKSSRLWWYDANKQYISIEGISNTYTAVANAKFFRVSFVATFNDVMIELNHNSSKYMPYGGIYNIREKLKYKAPSIIKTVAHQGYNAKYPRNSIAGVIGAATFGFNTVEGDVQKTLDGVYVMSHNDTVYANSDNIINPIRTSAGGGYTTPVTISETSYNDLLVYDFGAFAGEEFAGTTICTFDEWVKTAKMYGLSINIDHLLDYSLAELTEIATIVLKYNMGEYSIFNLMNTEKFSKIAETLDKFSVGLGLGSASEQTVTTWCGYAIDGNYKGICGGDVYFLLNYSQMTDTVYNIIHTNHFKVIVYTIDTKNDYLEHLPKTDGITSDSLNTYMVLS